MGALKIRRIDLTANNANLQLAKLRDQFRPDSEITTPQSKKLTLAVFGEALTPTQAVERICLDVKAKGVAAVLQYTEQLDKVKLKADAIRVKPSEIAEAHAAAAPEYLDVLRRIRYNVDSFQSGLLHQDALLRVSGQHELSMRYRPMSRVGVYCPGGAAAYPSTLLMTIVPVSFGGIQTMMSFTPADCAGTTVMSNVDG